MNLFRYFIHLSYDGTNYHGWQRQPNGNSVQQTLEQALGMILRAGISVTGAGRTDTGVHAPEYYAHFDLDHLFSDTQAEKLVFKLNSYLPSDISIRRIFPVGEGIHARFSAISRTYKYYISRRKDPFRYPYSFFLHGDIDVPLMNSGTTVIRSTSDFTSFSKVDTDTRTNLCTVSFAEWMVTEDELIFTITANRFLRNMVRAIAGTLLDLGRHRINLDDLVRIIDSKNRSDAGDSVPAKGLHLVKIDYPEGVCTF